ncbi:unnamed protein product [Amoebophrya sp. A25]|nr:unnamed protein product [Amoebophrya sp. A25]|eukprot:GSA25T00009339001.1
MTGTSLKTSSAPVVRQSSSRRASSPLSIFAGASGAQKAQELCPHFTILSPEHDRVHFSNLLKYSVRPERPPGHAQEAETQWTDARVACICVTGEWYSGLDMSLARPPGEDYMRKMREKDGVGGASKNRESSSSPRAGESSSVKKQEDKTKKKASMSLLGRADHSSVEAAPLHARQQMLEDREKELNRTRRKSTSGTSRGEKRSPLLANSLGSLEFTADVVGGDPTNANGLIGGKNPTGGQRGGSVSSSSLLNRRKPPSSICTDDGEDEELPLSVKKRREQEEYLRSVGNPLTPDAFGIPFRIKQYLANDYAAMPVTCAALCPPFGEVNRQVTIVAYDRSRRKTRRKSSSPMLEEQKYSPRVTSRTSPDEKNVDDLPLEEDDHMQKISSTTAAYVNGIDYGGRPCATICLYGTIAEVRILRTAKEVEDISKAGGKKTTAEELLHELVSSLAPALDPQKNENVRQMLMSESTTFASSTYWSRYPGALHGYTGPSSLFDISWNFGRENIRPIWVYVGALKLWSLPYLDGSSSAPASTTITTSRSSAEVITQREEARKIVRQSATAWPSSSKMEQLESYFYLDSVARLVCQEQQKNCRKGARQQILKSLNDGRAVEDLRFYKHSRNPHTFAWVRRLWLPSAEQHQNTELSDTIETTSTNQIKWPPQVGPYPLASRGYPKRKRVNGTPGPSATATEAYIACMDENSGCWDAMWHDDHNDAILLLQISPLAGMTERVFLRLVKQVIGAKLTTGFDSAMHS